MATKTNTRTTDAVEILIADHRKVQDLFKQFSQAGDRAYQTKQKLAEQIFHELEIHSALEEEIFYPAARQAAEAEVGEIVAEGIEEHHVVDLLIEELRGMDPHHEQYDAKMTVLCENVQHHIEEEEEEMLPGAKRKLGDRVNELGQQMQQRRQKLMASGSR